MRKDEKKPSKAKRTKKAAVKDLSPKDAKAVRGGKVAAQDFNFTHTVSKASTSL